MRRDYLPRRLLFELEQPSNGDGADGKSFPSREGKVPACDVANDRILRGTQIRELWVPV